MQHRSAPAPGGQGSAATGETVQLKGPQRAGRAKPHTQAVSHLWEGVVTSETQGAADAPGVYEAFITGLAEQRALIWTER